MYRIFFKKQRLVEKLIDGYLEHLRMNQESFVEALHICLGESCNGDFDFMTQQTHKYESKADDIREEIRNLMYSKALLPESRGDIMRLIEAIDVIPGIFELLLYMIKTEKIKIPDFIAAEVKELVSVSLASCDLMIQQIEALFKKNRGLRSLTATIDLNESHCDHIERRIITNIFDSDLEPFQKILLKEWVVTLGDISDQTDQVSKRINIINMKRTV